MASAAGVEDPEPMSPAQQIVQDNHYVPIAYLKGWADAERRLWVYRTLVSHDSVEEWRSSPVRGVGRLQHLYSRVINGAENDAFERWLAAEIDGPGSAALARVAGEERLTPSDWQTLVRFFAAAQARTLSFYLRRQAAWGKELQPLINGVLSRTVADLERSGGKPGPARAMFPQEISVEVPTQVRIRKREDGQGGVLEARVLAGRGLWLFELERLVSHTSEPLHDLSWTILRPPEGQSWLTSDDPAVVARISSERKVIFNDGMMVPDTVLFLPLDPQHLMFASVGVAMPEAYTRMPEADAAFVQKSTVHHAHRMVFAAAREDWVSQERPRRVAREAFEHEANELRNWPERQAAAERELDDETTWPASIPAVPAPQEGAGPSEP